MSIKIIKVQRENVAALAPLAADFRVALRSYKGIASKPNAEAGKEELVEFLDAGFPIYAALCREQFAGYMVCKVDAPCVWVESLFVASSFRGQGIADELIKCAENLSLSYGGETLYFNVHPNNHRMIVFLRKHGYSVLNLIEIRKPFPEEKLTQKVPVGDQLFDY